MTIEQFERVLATFLCQAAADGTLRERLTEGVREAREAMSKDDQARLDAEVERTIARCGVEDGRRHQ